jgi:hypothetical protein
LQVSNGGTGRHGAGYRPDRVGGCWTTTGVLQQSTCRVRPLDLGTRASDEMVTFTP